MSAIVSVTVPALAVDPAAMVRVVASDKAKSPATAPVPATACADTVSVAASLDGCESAAVTVATPPFSDTDDGDRASAAVGKASSSVIVPVPVGVLDSAAFIGALSVRATVSSGSSTSSPVTVTVTAKLISPAAKVSVPDDRAA